MKNFTILILVFLSFVGMLAFSGCHRDEGEGKDGDSGIYVGIIGFNDKITEYTAGKGKKMKKMRLLNSGTQTEFESFIDGLEVSNGTKLYHAVRVAIDDVQAAQLPDDLRNVSIITFTDGLDLGSYGESEYDSGDEYVQAISNRIQSEKLHNLQLNAYCIGMKGDDVGDEVKFSNDLKKLSSSEENAMLVSNISEVNEKFKEIAASLYKENVSQSLALSIPLPEKDQQLRFTFDVRGNSSDDAANSQMYIDFQFVGKSNPEIKNIVYHGISGSQTTIMGTTNDSYWYSYNFGGISLPDGNTVPTSNIKEWFLGGNGQWQINSEFDGGANVEVTTEKSSAAIFLVLDCSSSLGSDVSNMKNAAKNFIATLSGNNSGSGSGGSGSGSSSGVPGGSSSSGTTTGTLNGHDWVDLGLPSGLRWATCNVGASTPTAYGNYYAWGETSTKTTYSSSTYTYSDNPTTLPSSADAATANWGSVWRMPTKEEFEELKNNCTVTWTTQNGVNGHLFTGPNGNSVFLPAADHRDDISLYDAGSGGYYWSSSLRTDYPSYARGLLLLSIHCSMDYFDRYYGLSVRPVCVSAQN